MYEVNTNSMVEKPNPGSKPGPCDTELSKAQVYIDRLHQAIESLADRLHLVIAPVAPSALAASAESTSRPPAMCELHGRLQNCTSELGAAVARIDSMRERVAL